MNRQSSNNMYDLVNQKKTSVTMVKVIHNDINITFASEFKLSSVDFRFILVKTVNISSISIHVFLFMK